MNWTTIDGKSWSLTIGNRKAVVWLGYNEKTYHANTWRIEDNERLGYTDEFDCIEKAKKACLEAIENSKGGSENHGPDRGPL